MSNKKSKPENKPASKSENKSASVSKNRSKTGRNSTGKHFKKLHEAIIKNRNERKERKEKPGKKETKSWHFKPGAARELRMKAIQKQSKNNIEKYTGAGATGPFKRCVYAFLLSLGHSVFRKKLEYALESERYYIEETPDETGAEIQKLRIRKDALMVLKLHTEKMLSPYLNETIKNVLHANRVTVFKRDIKKTFHTECMETKLDVYCNNLGSRGLDSFDKKSNKAVAYRLAEEKDGQMRYIQMEKFMTFEDEHIKDYYNRRVILDLLLSQSEARPGLRISKEAYEYIRDIAKKILCKLLYKIGVVMKAYKRSTIKTKHVIEAATNGEDSNDKIYGMTGMSKNYSRPVYNKKGNNQDSEDDEDDEDDE